MATVKLSNVGNSKGIILQKRLLRKYDIREQAEIMEVKEGILIKKASNPRVGWAKAFEEGIKEDGYEQIMPDFLDDDTLEEYE